MSLCKLKISDVYTSFKNPKPSTRKWMKRQMNKYLRIQSKDVSEENLKPKKTKYRMGRLIVFDDYTDRYNGWTEITQDNVEGLYDVDPCRLMIATVDSHGNPQYAKYDGMSTTLDAIATIGGCYSFVLPELRLEE